MKEGIRDEILVLLPLGEQNLLPLDSDGKGDGSGLSRPLPTPVWRLWDERPVSREQRRLPALGTFSRAAARGPG